MENEILGSSELLNKASFLLPDFLPAGNPEKLSGGYTNSVHRIPGKPHSVITKQALPHMAYNREIKMPVSRMDVEFEALNIAAQLELATEIIKIPQILAYDGREKLLILSDLGNVSTFGEPDFPKNPAVSFELGRFLSLLHKRTKNRADIFEKTRNQAIQNVRNEVQYKPMAKWLRNAGRVGAAADMEALGEILSANGTCMIMGDFWPRSLLVLESGASVGIIDWEFSHFGRPLQDVAHFLAHLILFQITAPKERSATVETCMQDFLKGYFGETEILDLWAEDEFLFADMHVSAELWARSFGAFNKGYILENIGRQHPVMQKIQEEIALFSVHQKSVKSLLNRH